MRVSNVLVITGAMILSPLQATLAQDSPPLPTSWVGKITVTSVGAPTPHHPQHGDNVGKANAVKGFGFHENPLTIKIERQQGRHLEVSFTTPLHSSRLVGTLSADGRHLQLKSRQLSLYFDLDGKQMSGCGSANGGSGTIENWLDNYSALCAELQAAAESK